MVNGDRSSLVSASAQSSLTSCAGVPRFWVVARVIPRVCLNPVDSVRLSCDASVQSAFIPSPSSATTGFFEATPPTGASTCDRGASCRRGVGLKRPRLEPPRSSFESNPRRRRREETPTLRVAASLHSTTPAALHSASRRRPYEDVWSRCDDAARRRVAQSTRAVDDEDDFDPCANVLCAAIRKVGKWVLLVAVAFAYGIPRTLANFSDGGAWCYRLAECVACTQALLK
ncbi:hypothetical protein MTO96_022367 [Rhipicephalus appendiculatus]